MGGCCRLLVGFPEKVQSWEPAIQGCRPAFGKASCSSALLPAMWPQGPTLSCKDALEKVSQPRQLQPISVMWLPRLLGTTENPEVKKTDQSESECLKGKPAPQQAAWNAVRTQPAAIPARLHGGIRQGGQPQPPGSWRAPGCCWCGQPLRAAHLRASSTQTGLHVLEHTVWSQGLLPRRILGPEGSVPPRGSPRHGLTASHRGRSGIWKAEGLLPSSRKDEMERV